MNKHAYLILGHDDPAHLRSLIDALDGDWAHFYIHIDKKSAIGPFHERIALPNVAFVENRVKIYWGGWSQVEATLRTLAQAKASGIDFTYYTLMSGSHYPLRSSKGVYDYVEHNKLEYINIVEVPNAKLEKGMDRFTRFYIEGSNRRIGIFANGLGLLFKFIGRFPLRNPFAALRGWKLYAGSQWWTLSSAAISHIENVVAQNPRLVRYFRYVRIPDESFFQTIVGNSALLGQCDRATVYTDWSNPNDAPCFIRLEHLTTLLDPHFRLDDDYGRGPALYARKFGTRNVEVVNAIRCRYGGDCIAPNADTDSVG